MKLDFFEQKKAMGQLRKNGDAYRITHSRRPRGSQSGRVKRRDESFQAWADVLENFCRAFSLGPTDRPWVSRIRITRQWHFDYNYSLCTIMVKKVLRHICISGAFFSVEYNFWRAK